MNDVLVTTRHEEFAPYVRAKVFTATEVHAAERITDAALRGIGSAPVFLDYLSVAIAVWAPVNGHVCIDITNVKKQVRDELGSVGDDIDLQEQENLSWHEPTAWLEHLKASPLVFVPSADALDDVDYTKPLVLFGDKLYLTRQWVDEGDVAAALRSRLNEPPVPLSAAVETWISEVFANTPDDLQAKAVRQALSHNTSVLLGGPGTGKTYTIAGMLHALFSERDDMEPNFPLRVAIAAPTGKAADQVKTSVGRSLESESFPKKYAEQIASVAQGASTIHRLLGWLPGNRGRFAHHRQNQLPYDVVIIDEMSMVSLPLMARLLEALAPETKLILVGDPQQLKSVEAGAVLPDIATLASESHYPITKLVVNRRQEETAGTDKVNQIGKLAEMISTADYAAAAAESVYAFLKAGHDGVHFIELPKDKADPTSGEVVVKPLTSFLTSYETAKKHAEASEAALALEALASTRVLCGLRRGPYGVSTWNEIVAKHAGVAGTRNAVGQPLLNTRNDLRTGLVNGDTGIVVKTESGRRVVFPNHLDGFEPTSLENIEVAFATTVHKSQGSEFATVVVVLPPVGSPLLHRELLYTAITRARKNLVVIATKQAVLDAMTSMIQRESGLAAHIRAN
jgi:exodeoxyribonuclease V alpha subunit